MFKLSSRSIGSALLVLALLCLDQAPVFAQALNTAQQQKLLRHLQTKGVSGLFEKSQAAMLGVNNNGEHVPVRKVQF